MKEVKAYVHSSRIAGVIAALKGSAAWSAAETGDRNLTVYMVKGTLLPQGDSERHYSLDLGDEVINEYKLELHCEDVHVTELIEVIRTVGRTGQSNAGWIYVGSVDAAIPIT